MDFQKALAKLHEVYTMEPLILDFQARYLGDEASLFIETTKGFEEDTECWEIKFLQCYKVNYEIHIAWTDNSKFPPLRRPVKDLRGGQLYGYSGHSIDLSKIDDWLMVCKIVLSNMTIVIVCQDIEINKVLIKDQNFFWDDES